MKSNDAYDMSQFSCGLYRSIWKSAFPTIDSILVNKKMEKVKRMSDFFSAINSKSMLYILSKLKGQIWSAFPGSKELATPGWD